MRLTARRSAAARIVPFVNWRERERKVVLAGIEQELRQRYPRISNDKLVYAVQKINAYFDGPGARQEWERKRKK